MLLGNLFPPGGVAIEVHIGRRKTQSYASQITQTALFTFRGDRVDTCRTGFRGPILFSGTLDLGLCRRTAVHNLKHHTGPANG